MCNNFIPSVTICLIDADHIAPDLDGSLNSYRDAMNWLYKYENLSCNPENVKSLIPEGKQKYSVFHNEFTQFQNEFVSKMKYAAKSGMIYAIYETCLMDANYVKHKVTSVLEYKRKYLRECHPEILFKGSNKDFIEASVQIIMNELCSRVTYRKY